MQEKAAQIGHKNMEKKVRKIAQGIPYPLERFGDASLVLPWETS